MKILSAEQSREADSYTIDQEEISSLDLMERAAYALFSFLEEHFPEDQAFHIFCGMGNNGGDGLVLTRLLQQNGFPVKLSIVKHSEEASPDFEQSFKNLGNEVSWEYIEEDFEAIEVDAEKILIDAILGNGLDRSLEGLIARVVEDLKEKPNYKIAIDIPTGLFADDNSENDLKKVLAADLCLCIQSPKRSLLHAFTAPLAGRFVSIEIGLNQEFIADLKSDSYLLEKQDILELYRPRKKFSYKGTYGHLLILAGSTNTMGAAHITAESALYSGCGLATAMVPEESFTAFNIRLPELMLYPQNSEIHQLKGDFSALLAGPGLSTAKFSAQYLKKLIQAAPGPMVLDADALNILAENPTWLRFLAAGTILCPHPGEMKRLLKVKKLEHNYLSLVKDFAQKHQLNILLKDAISVLISKEGNFIFSDFATPALAKAGSGDCLTGIIGSLLSQSYSPKAAVCLALYLHGTAAKYAAAASAEESVLASDVSKNLGKAFKSLA